MHNEDAVAHLAPWRALALYWVVGLLWFGAGEMVLPLLVPDVHLYAHLQRAQAYAFVLASGCYAAWLLQRRWLAEQHQCKQQKALEDSEQQLRMALDGSGSGMWDWDMRSRRYSFSPRVGRMLGYSGADFAQVFRLQARLHPQDQPMVAQAVRQALRTGQPLVVTARVQSGDGSYRWLEARGMRHADAQGRALRFSGIVTDKTQQHLEQEHLRLAAVVVENMAEGIVVTDAHSRIIATNPAFSKMLGYSRQELLGQSPAAFKSGRHDRAFYEAMWQSMHERGHWRGEIWNKRKNGDIFPESMSLSAVQDPSGEVTHYVCMFTDISAQKRREQQLYQLAHTDALTGLANRHAFVQTLEQQVAAAAQQGQALAVIVLNLDRFKDINDSYGHAVGDQVLRHIAQQLQSALRPGDVIGRMAGDEMVVLARNVASSHAAGAVAEGLIAAAARPWQSPDGFAVVVNVHAGICCFPQHATQAGALVQGAHAAVYSAKEGQGGRHLWCSYHEDMTLAARDRMALEARLRHALAQGHLQLHYQPQVHLASGRIMGCEALLRWNDPQEGAISPARFIPVAERSGLIGPLGTWVLQEACRQAQAWRQQGLPAIRMAVNVSLHQLVLTDMVGCTRQALAQSGLPAQQLELEITESALATRPEEALQLLRALKALGVRLAIDDFGTGYSSLAHLKRFPIDVLKIDRGFISDIPHSVDDKAISHAIIAMGQSMGMEVLAEGVETPEQLHFLQQHACHYYQGYWCSKPVPAPAFAQLLQAQQAKLLAPA